MTTPALALDGGETIGRLYRRPGQPLPPGTQVGEDGRAFLRKRDAQEAVLAGVLLPSITNVIGVRNAPHLQRWYAKKAAQEAIRVAQAHPGLMTDRPHKAVDYLKRAGDRDRDEAAAQGDAVHNACEDLARGLPCPTLPPEQMLYVDSWKAWLDRYQPDFLYLEATVFGDDYAGTGDFIARINGLTVVGDYKTNRSGIHALDVACQLSAIAHAKQMSPDNAVLQPMVQVDAGVVVHLSREGYQCAPAVLGEPVWRVFRALRDVWEAHVLDGVLTDGSRAVGPVLRGPEALVASFGPRVAPVALAG